MRRSKAPRPTEQPGINMQNTFMSRKTAVQAPKQISLRARTRPPAPLPEAQPEALGCVRHLCTEK